jgi:ATP-dependent helicase/nuclease subunit B
MSGSSRHLLHLLPWGDDPLVHLARRLLAEQADRLPDLSRVEVLLAEPQAAPRLRRILLAEAEALGHGALLGPRIQTLQEWVMAHLPSGIRLCPPQLQRLILVEALQEHPDLIRTANPWALADDLLALFEELTVHRIGLPADLDAFTARLQEAYGLREEGISALGQEARLVHTLWQAWHAQLQAEGLTDARAAYLLALGASLAQIPDGQRLYLAGFHAFNPAEIDWLRTLLERDQACLVLHGQAGHGDSPHPDAPLAGLLAGLDRSASLASASDPASRVLNRIFDWEQAPLAARARETRDEFATSPLRDTLQVLRPHGAEEEARAIDLQVRRWLLEGRRRIGIVTENRRLARRVRALLERADIQLQDAAGWALSTTSAAATLERWLECLEEDFAHLPLLDLLKSPFLWPELDRDRLRLATLRLEQDIILHENIARGLDRYRAHIEDRRRRLPADWLAETAGLLLELLDRLQAAAAPLQQLRDGRHRGPTWLAALDESLAALGLDAGFGADPAGNRLQQLLEQLQQASRPSTLRLDWHGLRTWLGRALEQFHFQPPPSGHDVHLLGLAQSRLQCFDGLILAAAEREYLPGQPDGSPFFNDTVRRELGLPGRSEQIAERFYHFRRLLQAAPKVLITARAEQDGEPVAPSPWLEALQAFQRLAWEAPLDAGDLADLVEQPAAQVRRGDGAPLPAPPARPAPVAPPGLFKPAFSPGAYQQLLDCPYQYFAARGLRLAPPEEIRRALSKADYGERVHQCLQAFHQDVADLPGPFRGELNAASREAAIALLDDIARAVFARDLADNFEHQGWLQQWQQQIPAYVDWQIAREAAGWRVREAESRHQARLDETVELHGVLDRVEDQTGNRDGGRAVLDYKTGAFPKADAVAAGEAVQLPVYALLAGETGRPVTEVGYVDLSKPDTVKLPYALQDPELGKLAAAVGQRLIDLNREIEAGTGLPAWGDRATCRYCDMDLLCRRAILEDGTDG